MGTSAPILPRKKVYPARRSNKPQMVKTAVIAKLAHGATKSQIARDLDITRNCVTTIEEESGIKQHLQDGTSSVVGLIPEAIRVAKVRLAKDSENMAVKVLEWTVAPIMGHGDKAMTGDMHLSLAIQNLISPPAIENKGDNDSKAILSESSAAPPVATDDKP
jgi:hypothetical protein